MSKEFRSLLNEYAIACEDMGYIVAKENLNKEGDRQYKDARDKKIKLEKEILLHYANREDRINRKSTEGKSKTDGSNGK
jgi:hypothetical protein